MAFTQYSLGLVTVAIFGFVAQGCLGLQCVICDSSVLANCSSNPAEFKVQDCASWCKNQGAFIPNKPNVGADSAAAGVPAECPPLFTSCRKIKQSSTTKGLNDGKADERVIRTCGFVGNETQKIYDYRSSETSKSEVFSCFTDGCNSAVSMQASVVVAVVFAAFCRFFN